MTRGLAATIAIRHFLRDLGRALTRRTPAFDPDVEDRELAAHYTDGPGARPTEADRKRWIELAKTMPRSYRCPECRLLHRVGDPHD